MQFKVTYEHEVVITYEAIVEADSKEGAKQQILDGGIISEEEVGCQGIDYKILEVEEVKK